MPKSKCMIISRMPKSKCVELLEYFCAAHCFTIKGELEAYWPCRDLQNGAMLIVLQ